MTDEMTHIHTVFVNLETLILSKREEVMEKAINALDTQQSLDKSVT